MCACGGERKYCGSHIKLGFFFFIWEVCRFHLTSNMNVLTTKYAAHKKGKARLLVATTSLRRRVYKPLICFANSFFFFSFGVCLQGRRHVWGKVRMIIKITKNALTATVGPVEILTSCNVDVEYASYLKAGFWDALCRRR